jgi:hypothetical protein
MSTLREQIAARRAEVRKAATPVKAARGQVSTPARATSDDTLSEERTVSTQIKQAVRTGQSSPFSCLLKADLTM